MTVKHSDYGCGAWFRGGQRRHLHQWPERIARRTAVTLNTTTYPYATIYYTTDGSTPTYPPTFDDGIPRCTSTHVVRRSGTVRSDITVSTSQTIKAIAVAPGYSSPSAVSSATYTIN